MQEQGRNLEEAAKSEPSAKDKYIAAGRPGPSWLGMYYEGLPLQDDYGRQVWVPADKAFEAIRKLAGDPRETLRAENEFLVAAWTTEEILVSALRDKRVWQGGQHAPHVEQGSAGHPQAGGDEYEEEVMEWQGMEEAILASKKIAHVEEEEGDPEATSSSQPKKVVQAGPPPPPVPTPQVEQAAPPPPPMPSRPAPKADGAGEANAAAKAKVPSIPIKSMPTGAARGGGAEPKPPGAPMEVKPQEAPPCTAAGDAAGRDETGRGEARPRQEPPAAQPRINVEGPAQVQPTVVRPMEGLQVDDEGNWMCICRHKVLARHTACVVCGRGKNGLDAPAGTLPWRCSKCGHVNECTSGWCTRPAGAGEVDDKGRPRRCWAPKSEALATGEDFTGTDWICPRCEWADGRYHRNFSWRKQCRICEYDREYAERRGEKARLAKDFPAGFHFHD